MSEGTRSGDTGRVIRSAGSGLAANRLVRKRFEKMLVAEIAVPQFRQPLVLLVKLGHENVIVPFPKAGELLDAHVIVAIVVG